VGVALRSAGSVAFAVLLGFLLACGACDWGTAPQPPSPPPPVSPEPPAPIRPGPPETDSLFQLSYELAITLGDAVTARDMGNAILLACDAAEVSSTLIESIRIVQDAIRKVLESRQDVSDEVDWRNGWRAPVSDLVALRAPETPKAYAATMRFAARGLLAAALELGK